MSEGTRRKLLRDVEEELTDGRPAIEISRRLSGRVGEIVTSSFVSVPGLAVLAQGGLARGDLTPHADVDLLLLVDDGSKEEVAQRERAAERLLYALWDEGFQLGHAVRKPGELAKVFSKDDHAATAVLEARPLCGDLALATTTLHHVRRVLVPARRAHLLKAKRAELEERRARALLAHINEPNLKSGAGGLRDLHTLLWVGLLHVGDGLHGGDTLQGLLSTGFLFEREVAALRIAQESLLSMRIALHVAAGRAEDRLLSELQPRVVALLRLQPESYETRTEALLRAAYRASLSMRRTVDEVLSRVFRVHRKAPVPSKPLEPGFRVRENELVIEDADTADAAKLIDAFRLAAELGLALGPPARARLAHVVDALAQNPAFDDVAAGRALLRVCSSLAVRQSRPGPFTAMLEAGLLAGVLRDVHRLFGRVKQDGIHALTTDAHICHATDIALALVSTHEPAAVSLRPCLERTTRPHLVVLAALLHDIGKGLPDDHSKTGAVISARETLRMGLPDDERAILDFLVREHLSLSKASQRRDLSDPTVIAELAALVVTPERLDILALLTWIDMSAVAPGVATEWKAKLLATAVDRTRAFMLGDPHARGAPDVDERRRARAILEGRLPAAVIERFVVGGSARFLASRSVEELRADAAVFAHYHGDVVVDAAHDLGRAAHVVRLVAPDRLGLLADVAAGLSGEGASILDAHVDARSDGVAFDAFWIHDARGRALTAEALALVVAAIGRVVRASQLRSGSVQRTGRTVRRPGPRIEPRVRIVPGADSWGATVVEVRAADRLGLIADVVRAFADAGFSIALAKIHTKGLRATDVFYVESRGGGLASDDQIQGMCASVLAAAAG